MGAQCSGAILLSTGSDLPKKAANQSTVQPSGVHYIPVYKVQESSCHIVMYMTVQ